MPNDAPSEKLKIFISSTYEDLVDCRLAVDEQLRRMSEYGIGMEHSGASGMHPTEFSLARLEECNVYLGIIGYRFGTFSPDNEYSIVQREYQRAYELYSQNRMSLLIFLAAKENSDPRLRESDELRKKQISFRKDLMIRHTYEQFTDEIDLALRVAPNLYKLLLDKKTPGPQGLEFFEEGNWDAIKERFDSSDEQNKRIEEFFGVLLKLLEPVFKIEPRQAQQHPLFKQSHEHLKNIIPGISLNEEQGILKRTGVKHVILRRQTAVFLIEKISADQRRGVGREIGGTAAANLIENTIKSSKLIPASAEAFITLLDYWDRTGGWGKLRMIRPNQVEPHPADPKSTTAEWNIRIENNFLHEEGDLVKTHELCEFWCGYLEGVLNKALPEIGQLMREYNHDRSRVSLPEYSRVKSVVHNIQGDTSLTTDDFVITFVEEPFSAAQRNLASARRNLNNSEHATAALYCVEAVRVATHELQKQFPDDKCPGKVQEKSEAAIFGLDAVSVACIQSILSGEANPAVASKDTAKLWLETVSKFIDGLAALVE